MITCYVFNFQRDVIISMKIYMSLSPFIYLHFYIGHFLPYPDLHAKNHYIITRRCYSYSYHVIICNYLVFICNDNFLPLGAFFICISRLLFLILVKQISYEVDR